MSLCLIVVTAVSVWSHVSRSELRPSIQPVSYGAAPLINLDGVRSAYLRSIRYSRLPRDTRLPTEASGSSEASISQQIAVAVLSGPLTITPSHIRLELDQRGDSLRVALPAITVVDARGSLTGWAVTLTVGAADGMPAGDVRARIVPDDPRVVYGEPFGLRAGAPDTISGRHPVVLCAAEPGNGGGTYLCGGNVDLHLEGNHGIGGRALTLTMTATVH